MSILWASSQAKEDKTKAGTGTREGNEKGRCWKLKDHELCFDAWNKDYIFGPSIPVASFWYIVLVQKWYNGER